MKNPSSKPNSVVIMSFIKPTDVEVDVVLQKLEEPIGSSLLFDVPNPESDIDPSKSAEEGWQAVISSLERTKSRMLQIAA